MNNNQVVEEHRKKDWLKIKDLKKTYTQKEYKEFIRIHYKTLLNYLKQFRYFFFEYMRLGTRKNRHIISRVWKLKQRKKIYNGLLLPSINEIWLLFHNLNLKMDFEKYLFNKTHFSYDVSGREIKAEWMKQDDKKRVYYKFAEFVYLILSEYIILHNKMWSSGLKCKGVKSIDKWLKDI